MKLFLILILIPALSWASCPQWSADKAKSQMTALQAEVAHHDDLYFNRHAPILSDSEYDALKKQLQTLQACFPEIARKSQALEPLSDETPHKAFMGSLKKADSTSDIQAFLKAAGKESILVQPKVDGVAVELIYQQGKLIAASTRGDGDKGQNILDSIQFMPAIPKAIKTQYSEIILHGELFARLDTGKDYSGYASARHFVAGQLSRSEPNPLELADIEFFPWLWVNSPFETDNTTINMLYSLGFDLPTMYTESVKTLEDVIKIRDLYHKRAGQEPFLMDGIVLKLDNLKARDQKGWNGSHPAWAIAWKFPPEAAVTEVKGVDFRIGRIGHITPVLQLKPVALNGETVQQVSLGSLKKYQTLDIAVNDKISVVLKGAATPVFSKVIFRPENRSRPQPPVASHFNAFSCLTYSLECAQQFMARLQWFISRLDIPTLDKPKLEALIQSGELSSLKDLLRLSKQSLIKAGLSPSNAEQIIRALKAVSQQPFADQLRAISLPEIGKRRSEKLSEHFRNWSALIQAPEQDIAAVAKMSGSQVQQVKRYLEEEQVRKVVDLM